jgi:surface polysaccharide O-acyltransferase-like enzyme
MPSMLNTVSLNLLHPVAGLVDTYNSTLNTNKFDNTSNLSLGLVIFICIVAIVLWIMLLIATYRLTHSALQVVLCLLFGSIYLFCAWIYHVFNKYRLVKN